VGLSPLKREPLPFSVERGELRLVDKTYTDTHNESQDSGRQLDFPSPILMCVAPCLNWPKFGCQRSARHFHRLSQPACGSSFEARIHLRSSGKLDRIAKGNDGAYSINKSPLVNGKEGL